ncbi:MAG: hypothetical protein RG741_08850 [Bacteroidales bacterium]|nr:hypothetical protein [Bacteroidales bacterium]
MAFPDPERPPDNFEYDVNIRPVYYYISTTDRDGTEHIDRSINLRARLGFSYHMSNSLTFRIRSATRLSNTQEGFRFLLEDHTGGGGSYPAGTATIDELMLRWQITPELRLTAGRFQGRFPLAGFIPKGVDRYYAANLAISHTDGIWMEWNISDTWRLHLIGSHNSTAGSSHAARSPLRFDASGASRVSGFANIQHRNTQDRWAQRELSISVTPKNFYRDGKLRNHVTLSTRWMYRAAFSISGEEYLLGGEAGFIPVAPRPEDFGLQVGDDRLLFGRSAVSWQLSAYVNNIAGRHRLGILYGQTDPHWLISSSFAPNVTMAELRYRYTITSWINYEFRFRLRDEKFRPADADQTRQIFDFYTRFTLSF